MNRSTRVVVFSVAAAVVGAVTIAQVVRRVRARRPAHLHLHQSPGKPLSNKRAKQERNARKAARVYEAEHATEHPIV